MKKNKFELIPIGTNTIFNITDKIQYDIWCFLDYNGTEYEHILSYNVKPYTSLTKAEKDMRILKHKKDITYEMILKHREEESTL